MCLAELTAGRRALCAALGSCLFIERACISEVQLYMYMYIHVRTVHDCVYVYIHVHVHVYGSTFSRAMHTCDSMPTIAIWLTFMR